MTSPYTEKPGLTMPGWQCTKCGAFVPNPYDHSCFDATNLPRIYPERPDWIKIDEHHKRITRIEGAAMKYIYIAGPYSVGDTAVNVRNAILAADLVAAKGYVPYVPHVLHFWHLVLPHDYEFWTTLDFAWLKRCDAVLRLPGVSLGADTEVAMASLWGMPIYFNVEELP